MQREYEMEDIVESNFENITNHVYTHKSRHQCTHRDFKAQHEKLLQNGITTFINCLKDEESNLLFIRMV